MRLLASALLLFAATTVSAQEGLDLPIPAPVFGRSVPSTDTPPEVPTSGDEGGDDPRDTPPPSFYGEDIDPESDALVYVLDFSCSMSLMEPAPFRQPNGSVTTGTRRERLLAEVEISLSKLSESFKFSIVVYGTSFTAFKTELVPANAENKVAAMQWLSEKRCLGMTITGPATVYGFSLQGHEHILLLTDGRPNWDGASVREPPWHRALIRNRNERGVTVDVFGLGLEAAARTFCRGVASDSGGQFFEIY